MVSCIKQRFSAPVGLDWCVEVCPVTLVPVLETDLNRGDRKVLE
jgi:hypothetical protein